MLVNHLKKSYAVLTIDVSTHMTAVLYPLGGCSVWVSVFLGLNPLGPLDLDQSKSLSVGPKWCIPWTKYQLDQLLPVCLYRY